MGRYAVNNEAIDQTGFIFIRTCRETLFEMDEYFNRNLVPPSPLEKSASIYRLRSSRGEEGRWEKNKEELREIDREEVEISKYKYSLGESIRTISNFSFLLDDACIIKTQLTPCYLHRGEKDEAKYDILSHTYWQEEQRKRKYRKRNRTEWKEE